MPSNSPNPKMKKLDEILTDLLNAFWDLSEEEQKEFLETRPSLERYLTDIGAFKFH